MYSFSSGYFFESQAHTTRRLITKAAMSHSIWLMLRRDRINMAIVDLSASSSVLIEVVS